MKNTISVLRANSYYCKDDTGKRKLFEPKATKKISFIEGKYVKQHNDFARYFHLIEHDVSNIFELSDLLSILQFEEDCFIFRAQIKPDVKNHRFVNRLIHDKTNTKTGKVEKANFQMNSAGLNWLMIDIDGHPLPSHIVSNRDSLEFGISLLPEQFHDASYHYQWSSSQSLDGWRSLSVHLFFWLEQPWRDDILKDRAETEKWECDERVFSPAQIHYTAGPIFLNCDDPIASFRYGLIKKTNDSVDLGVYKKPSKPAKMSVIKKRTRSGLAKKVVWDKPKNTKSFTEHLAEIGPRFHMPIQRSIAAYIAVNGSNCNTEKLKKIIINAIYNAPKGKSDKEDYYKDDYLDRSIKGAIDKYGEIK